MAPTPFRVGGLLLIPAVLLGLFGVGLEILRYAVPLAVCLAAVWLLDRLCDWGASRMFGVRDTPVKPEDRAIPPEPQVRAQATPRPTFTIVDEDDQPV